MNATFDALQSMFIGEPQRFINFGGNPPPSLIATTTVAATYLARPMLTRSTETFLYMFSGIILVGSFIEQIVRPSALSYPKGHPTDYGTQDTTPDYPVTVALLNPTTFASV